MYAVLLRLIGWILLLFVAAPLLFASIWIAGIAKCITSSELLVDFPAKAAQQFPQLLNNYANSAAAKPNSFTKNGATAWFIALQATPSAVLNLLTESGLVTWAQNDLVAALANLYTMIEGTTDADEVDLETSGLVAAGTSSVMSTRIAEAVVRLPACTTEEKAFWQQPISFECQDKVLPACNPGQTIFNHTYRDFQAKLVSVPKVVRLSDVPIDALAMMSFLLMGLSVMLTVIAALMITFRPVARMRVAVLAIGVVAGICILSAAAARRIVAMHSFWPYLNPILQPLLETVLRPVTTLSLIGLGIGFIGLLISYFLPRMESGS